jgi:hypothetical protein
MDRENFLKRKMKRNNFKKSLDPVKAFKPTKNFEGKNFDKLNQIEMLYKKAKNIYEQRVRI